MFRISPWEWKCFTGRVESSTLGVGRFIWLLKRVDNKAKLVSAVMYEELYLLSQQVITFNPYKYNQMLHLDISI
ncbi:CLUMA_CG001856, isoform A [Clunio marinus]|uniref:CLUMA_CG001856, isoform A n=1 Tax=Clunio marinus TaxID=568069 RepID=A0A1J1HJ70_9DIPT|nr:CLUMA_CG001856, isoform A [Clunio marinus]